MRKKLKQAGIDNFDYVVEQNIVLCKKIQLMRQKGLTYQEISDLFNIWKVNTRSRNGKWYAKTVRDLDLE